MHRDVVALADGLGARDVLVLRRLRPGEWFHTGGLGRPAGWAGALVADEREGLLRRAEAGTCVRVLATAATPVVGPYWAATAVLVPVAADLIVVWGHPGRSPALVAAADADLREASRRLAHAIDDGADGADGADGSDGAGGAGGDAGAVRRLSQELQVLAAVQSLTGSLDSSVEEALRRVAGVVASTLDLAGAATWLGDGRCAVVGLGVPARDVVAAAAAHAPPPVSGMLLAAQSFPGEGIGQVLLLGLDVPGGGALLAAQSSGDPVAFTDLRRRIGEQLAGTAASLLQVVLARELVERQLSDTKAQLGRDALTSAGSRHRWDVELAAAQDLVDAGEPVCVALLDLDDLKWVNDTHGHAAGDELLQVCADAVRGSLRGGSDVVARVGGDEFGVLVPRATDALSLGERLRRGVESARTSFGVALRVSVGAARCEPGEQVTAAFAAADAAMYEDKRLRRAARGLPPRAQAGARR